jgi:hypothetical protein
MMFSTKARRLCPYLKKTAVRQEAASSSFSLPKAMTECPYVKELYKGFESQPEGNTQSNVSNTLKGVSFTAPSTAEPKLFKMEKDIAKCICEQNGGDYTKNCEQHKCLGFEPSKTLNMYDDKFDHAISELKDEGRYRKFINVERHKGNFPNATRRDDNKKSEVVVWCSNDYLGMGQNQKVLDAMHQAIDSSGAGSGGTRNIGGNTKYIESLENEISELHGKEKSLVCSS